MKRKSIALLLALAMCLSLLSACGGDNAQNTGEPTTSDSTPETTGQQPADEKEEQPSQQPEETEEPTQEPEESEEPTQEPENNAGAEFLALAKEEYNAWKHNFLLRYDFYYTLAPDGETIYIDGDGSSIIASTYNITTKEYISYEQPARFAYYCILDGCFYGGSYDGSASNYVSKYKPGGELIVSSEPFGPLDARTTVVGLGDKIALLDQLDQDGSRILSTDLELIGEIPLPQQEVAHGLIEPVELNLDGSMLIAGGTVYATSDTNFYRLDADALEWVDVGARSDISFTYGKTQTFYGKYRTDKKVIYDWLTGEQVFEYGELYPSAALNSQPCYWGGDQYLGYKDGEYRWVNLKDGTMSEPLPFPDHQSYVINDTYCVYKDQYGLFLWNYNTGEEETITLFEK